MCTNKKLLNEIRANLKDAQQKLDVYAVRSNDESRVATETALKELCAISDMVLMLENIRLRKTASIDVEKVESRIEHLKKLQRAIVDREGLARGWDYKEIMETLWG